MMNIASRLFLVLLFLFSASVYAHGVKIPKSPDELTLTKVANNVYVIHGIQAMPDQKNQGFISNASFIVSDAGVVVIDTGGSFKYGQFVVQKIREVTDKPVIAVINTHMHGDHWLGNAAIRESHPDAGFYGHELAISRLQSGEAEQWLDMFAQAIGKEVVGNTTVIPDKPLKDGDAVKLAGGTYKIHHKGKAHTDNDIMIEYPGGKTLFAGDIVVHGSVPSGGRPQDFSARGQIKSVAHALSLPIDIYVPGHGPTGGKEIPEATKRFLDILYTSVKKYFDEGLQDFEMRDKVAADLAEFSSWRGMDEIGRMISFVYQEVEAAEFE